MAKPLNLKNIGVISMVRDRGGPPRWKGRWGWQLLDALGDPRVYWWAPHTGMLAALFAGVHLEVLECSEES